MACIEPLEARIAPAFAPVLELSGLNGANGFKLAGEAANDDAGHSVSGIGDFNGDSYDDFIIGAQRADASFSSLDTGISYVVFGKAAGFPPALNLASLNGANGFKIVGAAAQDQSGTSVSGGGDINGDGFDDLIVGAHLADPTGMNSGAAYVIFGHSGAFPASLRDRH